MDQPCGCLGLQDYQDGVDGLVAHCWQASLYLETQTFGSQHGSQSQVAPEVTLGIILQHYKRLPAGMLPLK